MVPYGFVGKATRSACGAPLASSRATTIQPSVPSDFADADEVSVSGADAPGASGMKSPWLEVGAHGPEPRVARHDVELRPEDGEARRSSSGTCCARSADSPRLLAATGQQRGRPVHRRLREEGVDERSTGRVEHERAVATVEGAGQHRPEVDADHEVVGRRAAGDVDGDVELVLARVGPPFVGVDGEDRAAGRLVGQAAHFAWQALHADGADVHRVADRVGADRSDPMRTRLRTWSGCRRSREWPWNCRTSSARPRW